MFYKGDIVTSTSPKLSKLQAECFIIVANSTENEYLVVPCWTHEIEYTLCIWAYPGDLYVKCKKYYLVDEQNLNKHEQIQLKNCNDALNRIITERNKYSHKKHIAKMLKNKEKQREKKEKQMQKFENKKKRAHCKMKLQ